jgi:hypothetical protein
MRILTIIIIMISGCMHVFNIKGHEYKVNSIHVVCNLGGEVANSSRTYIN